MKKANGKVTTQLLSSLWTVEFRQGILRLQIELINASSRERRLNRLIDFNRRSRDAKSLRHGYPGLERPG
ncbi:MAG: hypothetical protein L0229_04235 [Blastocatellia bacterium]|nr:hypothetical protein [Blastocatellia bacterium]